MEHLLGILMAKCTNRTSKYPKPQKFLELGYDRTPPPHKNIPEKKHRKHRFLGMVTLDVDREYQIILP